MNRLTLVLTLAVAACARTGTDPDQARWHQRAEAVTITRDDWGIPHIHGKTDADAVFGMVYAQAEDDFNRIEMNYINALGRLAETEGESALYRDLRMKIFIDPDSLRAGYRASPGWLKELMNAWADGLNYYLSTHPTVRPKVIARFEPWMALSFSEGSIGGDIERISLRELEAFYGNRGSAVAARPGPNVPSEPTGSNGIAIAPSNTSAHRALLLINPHTSFFFRAELQVTSDEGLDAYGAATWGQFFIYQGFNRRVGWMHTSSSVDAIDEYAETVTKNGQDYGYRYGAETRPVTSSIITVPYQTAAGVGQKHFTVFRTHHGPVIREADGQWITIRLMHDPVKALTQSYRRTKAHDYRTFRETLELHTNSSNNTVFASADGDIAYFHANFVPKRDPRFDWRRPVDGSNPETEWRGIHSIDESPNIKNPSTGWVYNTNNWPYSAAGPDSPKRADYPQYMDGGSENYRGIHAIRVLENRRDWSLSTLIAAAYDSYLPAFAELIPVLLRAYDRSPSSPEKAKLAEPVAALRSWDYRWAVGSVPTSVAIFWADELGPKVGPDAQSAGLSPFEYIASRAPAKLLLEALAAATAKLTADFGSWRTPWGEINRFQRLTDDLVHPFSDAAPSIPVGFTSATWGSLAAYGARPYNGSKKIYGTGGNSFVAVVEFGDSVRAKAVTAGGESGDPASPHFNDQAVRYSTGDLRDVYFYPSQLVGHTERTYRPGEEARTR